MRHLPKLFFASALVTKPMSIAAQSTQVDLATGDNPIIAPVYLLALAGLVLLLVALWARKTGRLNRGFSLTLVVLVGIVAALLWLGPALFMAT